MRDEPCAMRGCRASVSPSGLTRRASSPEPQGRTAYPLVIRSVSDTPASWEKASGQEKKALGIRHEERAPDGIWSSLFTYRNVQLGSLTSLSHSYPPRPLGEGLGVRVLIALHFRGPGDDIDRDARPFLSPPNKSS